MVTTILGRKLGMTMGRERQRRSCYRQTLSGPQYRFTGKKTVETDGYNAVQIGFMTSLEKHVNIPVTSRHRASSQCVTSARSALRDAGAQDRRCCHSC